MKSLILIPGVASIIASPAFAQTAKRHQARPVAPSQLLGNGPQAAAAAPDAVVLDDQYVARDPDPQVRLELQRSAPFYQHGGY